MHTNTNDNNKKHKFCIHYMQHNEGLQIQEAMHHYLHLCFAYLSTFIQQTHMHIDLYAGL